MNISFYIGYLEMLSRDGAEKTARWASEHGFSSVEVLETTSNGHPAVIPDADAAAAIKKTLDAHGLSTACYSVGTTVFDDPAAEARLRYHAEIAAALGCPYLHHTLYCTLAKAPSDPPEEAIFASVAEAAVRVAHYAETLGVTCLYEDQGPYINGIRGFGRFFDEVHRLAPNTGVCGDFGNILFVDESPTEFLSAFAADIRHVHVKDYLRKSFSVAPPRGWYRTQGGQYLRDTTVGSGVIDIPACMRILADAGYDGAYALELCHPEPFEDGVRDAMEYLHRCI